MSRLVASLCALVLASSSTVALAKGHKVQPGETLVQIAKTYGCSVAELQRANDLDTTLIRAGSTVTVPSCAKPKAKRVATATPAGRASAGTPTRTSRAAGQSVGAPWDGALRSPSRLASGKGYVIRRPQRTYAAAHVVASMGRALSAFRAKFPKAHTIAIGDLSAQAGGPISDHRSHQSGRDADVGLVFKTKPSSYPASFVSYTDAELDLAATWGLLKAFVRTADDARGVAAVYLDFDLQGKLYKWAKAHGVDDGYLRRIFQYPHGRGASAGLVRHEPNHDDHLHVRWKCAPEDKSCE